MHVTGNTKYSTRKSPCQLRRTVSGYAAANVMRCRVVTVSRKTYQHHLESAWSLLCVKKHKKMYDHVIGP